MKINSISNINFEKKGHHKKPKTNSQNTPKPAQDSYDLMVDEIILSMADEFSTNGDFSAVYIKKPLVGEAKVVKIYDKPARSVEEKVVLKDEKKKSFLEKIADIFKKKGE